MIDEEYAHIIDEISGHVADIPISDVLEVNINDETFLDGKSYITITMESENDQGEDDWEIVAVDVDKEIPKLIKVLQAIYDEKQRLVQKKEL